ncbi:hypothetical protein EXIGLDRAFT_784249 [Exidia glandulosa HHB12029]|uniref:Uncharacterized protein n=1 Tax=Exidia glandulosa HHB12029 TaxID=1314781 RepID=A0A166MKR0_EXIGL|nr:hypothetical protein EXIGLDRAFT_784249 [Exidia glandulosa HHB12029]
MSSPPSTTSDEDQQQPAPLPPLPTKTALDSGNGTASSLFRSKQAHRDDAYQRQYLTPNRSGALTSHPT